MEEKKVSKVKSVICFIITVATVYILSGMLVEAWHWANQNNPPIETEHLICILKFLGVLLINIINGVIAFFELKNTHESYERSFIKHAFCNPLLLFSMIVILFFLVGGTKALKGSGSSGGSSSSGSGTGSGSIKCVNCQKSFPKIQMKYIPEDNSYMCPTCIKWYNSKRGF